MEHYFMGRLINGIRSVDGVNHIIRVPKAASLDFQVGNSFSFAAWVVLYQSDPIYGIQLYSNNELEGNGYFFIITESNINISLRDPAGFKRNLPIGLSVPFNKLIHVAGTVNGSNPANWKNYLNGAPLPSGTVVNNNVTNILSNRDGFIGTYSVSNQAKGSKDILNLQIYNKALSDAEVAYLYAKEGVVPSSAVASNVANWRFRAKSGTILKDDSGRNNHGTFGNWQDLTDLNPNLGITNSWINAYSLQPITA